MSMNKKIVFLAGDSLSCSRNQEQIRFLDLYSSKLATDEELSLLVVDRSKRANTTSKFLNDFEVCAELQHTPLDYLIIQLGIVDCFPRNFYEMYEKHFALLSRVFFLRPFITGLRHYCARNRLRSSRKKLRQFVPIDRYKQNIKKMISLAREESPSVNVILIGIFPPGKHLQDRGSNIVQIVSSYNSVLREVSKEFDAFYLDVDTSQMSELVLSDGHHINHLAHVVLYEKIKNYMLSKQ